MSAAAIEKESDSASKSSLTEAESQSKGATPEPEARLKKCTTRAERPKKGNYRRNLLLSSGPPGRVSIDLALDSSIFRFHGTDFCFVVEMPDQLRL